MIGPESVSVERFGDDVFFGMCFLLYLIKDIFKLVDGALYFFDIMCGVGKRVGGL
jgi:hypothetical protein